MARRQGEESDGRFLRGRAGRSASSKASKANQGTLRPAGVVPFRSDLAASSSPEPAPWESGEFRLDALPQRYDYHPGDDEHEGYLRCREAPGLRVYLDRGYAFNEAEARRLGERVVLLDGAGQFAPTLDSKQQFYNLDHHDDCLRAFTLATCEQALILVAKGLALDKGDWSIYANEPDLDTLFALWVLLNYRRLLTLPVERRDRIVPLLRLEGAIDANGFDVAEYCGLPRELLAPARATLDRLQRRELELKQAGEWAEADLGPYVVEMLGEIDKLVYERADFDDFASVEEEYGHVEIGDDRAAVICRDAAGIFEVEKRLKRLWGDRLGIVVLEKEPGHFTLRRAASLADIDLAAAYDTLNLLDPVVDGRPPTKRWGGSDEIGGSPRPTGTGLKPREIGAALWRAYRKRGRVAKLKQVGLALLLSAGIAAVAGLVTILWQLLAGPAQAPAEAGRRLATAAVAVLVLALLLTLQFAHRRQVRLFGWRRPAGKDWWLLVPAALVGAFLCGAWIDPAVGPISDWSGGAKALVVVVLGLWAVAAELSWRGLSHGLLLFDFPVQRVAGRWFVSVPTLVSSALCAVVAAAAFGAGMLRLPIATGSAWVAMVLVIVGGLLSGVSLGMIRERSLSLWPGAVVQWLGWLAAVWVLCGG